ncbi:MAG TPA: hypothetical protein PK922_13485 [Syntrophorhabdus sp.]|nr:hypothetical protein [Syntrophorhabdus sp.]
MPYLTLSEKIKNNIFRTKQEQKISSIFRYILTISKYVVFVCDLEKWQKKVDISIVDGLSIEDVNSKNVKDINTFRGEKTLHNFIKFYEDNCLGVYAYFNGNVVGCQWAEFNNTKQYRISHEEVLLLPGEGAMWSGRVANDFRGKRIHSFFRNRLEERMKNLGCKILLSHNLENNESIILANRRYLKTDFSSKAIMIKAILNTVTFYKASDRWYLRLKMPRTNCKGFCIAWSKYAGIKLMRS